MDDEKRMVEGYEITQSLYIGDKEVVFGVDEENENPYLCAYCKSNELFRSYFDCQIGSDYSEIMGIYSQRIREQIDKVQQEREQVTVPTEPIREDMCIPDSRDKDIEGKVVVIKVSSLRPEYQRADRQLWYCTGGFGARANSRGSACFCINLYSGKKSRWERSDIAGEMKELPEWAKERATEIRAGKETPSKAPKCQKER